MRRETPWRIPVFALFLAFMILPVIATVLFSVATRWDRTIWPEDLTFAWWIKVTERSAFKRTLINSSLVAMATVAVSTILVTPTVYLAHLRLPRAKIWIELVAIIPFALPGVVLALGLIRFYSGVTLPIINTPNILIASYVILTLPFMYRPVMNALEAIDARTLTEVAQSLGAGTWRTLVFVILPNILGGVVNGGLLVFSTVMAEFALANLLIGTRFKTFPIYLVEFTRFDARQASALAVTSFVFAWAISLVILWVAGRGAQPRMAVAAR